MDRGGKDERERIMFGRMKASVLSANDRATRTGIITGYRRGAGSKLDGMIDDTCVLDLDRREILGSIRKGYAI